MRLKNWVRFPQDTPDDKCMSFAMYLADGVIISIMNCCFVGGGWTISSGAAYSIKPILDCNNKYETLDEAELAAIAFLQSVRESYNRALTEA